MGFGHSFGTVEKQGRDTLLAALQSARIPVAQDGGRPAGDTFSTYSD